VRIESFSQFFQTIMPEDQHHQKTDVIEAANGLLQLFQTSDGSSLYCDEDVVSSLSSSSSSSSSSVGPHDDVTTSTRTTTILPCFYPLVAAKKKSSEDQQCLPPTTKVTAARLQRSTKTPQPISPVTLLLQSSGTKRYRSPNRAVAVAVVAVGHKNDNKKTKTAPSNYPPSRETPQLNASNFVDLTMDDDDTDEGDDEGLGTRTTGHSTTTTTPKDLVVPTTTTAREVQRRPPPLQRVGLNSPGMHFIDSIVQRLSGRPRDQFKTIAAQAMSRHLRHDDAAYDDLPMAIWRIVQTYLDVNDYASAYAAAMKDWHDNGGPPVPMTMMILTTTATPNVPTTTKQQSASVSETEEHAPETTPRGSSATTATATTKKNRISAAAQKKYAKLPSRMKMYRSLPLQKTKTMTSTTNDTAAAAAVPERPTPPKKATTTTNNRRFVVVDSIPQYAAVPLSDVAMMPTTTVQNTAKTPL
jgi:hypothetical protein